MTKKDKAYLAEGLHRLCADLAAIATLFEQPEEATPKPTPAGGPPAAPAPEENTEQAPAPNPDSPAEPAPVPPAEPIAKPVTYEEVRAILSGCYQQALDILREHLDQLRGLGELLIEKETISREEFLRFLTPPVESEGTVE